MQMMRGGRWLVGTWGIIVAFALLLLWNQGEIIIFVFLGSQTKELCLIEETLLSNSTYCCSKYG
jgi:hypothetical protein